MLAFVLYNPQTSATECAPHGLEQLLACLLWSSPAWKMAPRDQWEATGQSIVAFFEDRLWNLQEVLDLTSQLVELVPGRSSPHKEPRRRHRRRKSRRILLTSCPPSLWPHRSSRSPY